MRKSPQVLRISRWLETQAGHIAAYGLVSISPVSAIVFDLNSHPEVAIKVTAAGIILLCLGMPVVFWVCGSSLVRGIDESLRLQQRVHAARTTWGSEDGLKNIQSVQHDLKAARTKVKRMVAFSLFICGNVIVVLLFAVCSKYGTAAPLLLFATPMALFPSIWNSINIQLHGRRSRTIDQWRLSGGDLTFGGHFAARLSGTARRLSSTSILVTDTARRLSGSAAGRWSARKQGNNQVVPTEIPLSPPC